MACKPGVLYLFDVDGTLTAARKVIEPAMDAFMKKVQTKVTCGLVGGSDLPKISEQLGGTENVMQYEYVFAENGLVAYKNGVLIDEQSITSHLGEETLQRLINFSLQYMSKITLPAKRGNFIEYRSGLINICPVGRSCTQEIRDNFVEYDKEHLIREKFVEALEEEFSEAGLTFTIGGQISLDAFPIGWDKTFCLQYVEKDFSEIHFFGDKTYPGGNDHAIYEDDRTIGHQVTSWSDTMQMLKDMLDLDS